MERIKVRTRTWPAGTPPFFFVFTLAEGKTTFERQGEPGSAYSAAAILAEFDVPDRDDLYVIAGLARAELELEPSNALLPDLAVLQFAREAKAQKAPDVVPIPPEPEAEPEPAPEEVKPAPAGPEPLPEEPAAPVVAEEVIP